MRTTPHFRYASKVWLTSLFLSPAVILILSEGGAFLRSMQEAWMITLLFILFGGLFSIPNWLLLTAGVRVINGLSLPVRSKKLIIQGLAAVLTFGLFWIFFEGGNLENIFKFTGLYLVTLTFGIWLYPLEGGNYPGGVPKSASGNLGPDFV